MTKRHITISINECKRLAYALSEAKAMTANGLDFQAKSYSAHEAIRLERWHDENEIQQRAIYALLHNVAERIKDNTLEARDVELIEGLAYSLGPAETPETNTARDIRNMHAIIRALEPNNTLLDVLKDGFPMASRRTQATHARLVLTTILEAQREARWAKARRIEEARQAEEQKQREARKQRRAERAAQRGPANTTGATP